MNLPGLGTISYNGWTFQGPRVSVELDIDPVYDEAQRTLEYCIFRFTVSAIVTNDALGQAAGSDDSVSSDTAAINVGTLRNLLMKTGGQFSCSGWGFGDITANLASNDRDVMWGPKTTSLHIAPIGRALAHEVLWTVELARAECGSSVPSPVGTIGNIRSFNYGCSYSVDNRGLTVRTIRGHIAIILNRSAAGAVNFVTSADTLRNRIKPAVPVQFARERQEWDLSPDKSRLDFTIVDRELPSENAFPQGVSSMEARHTVRVVFPKLNKAENVISGSVEVVKGYALAFAMQRILLFLRERVFVARFQSKGLFITSIEVTEHVFARRLDFSLSYYILTSGPGEFLTISSLMKPVASTNMQAWASSMDQTAWHERGIARLTFQPANDRIIDPCNQGTTGLAETGQYTSPSSSFGTLSCQCPPKSASYYYWKNSLEIDSESGVALHVPMPTSSSGSSSSGESPSLGDGTTVSGMDFVQPIPPTIQIVNNRVRVFMRGSAIRVGYPSEIPQLVRFLNSSNEFRMVKSYVSNTPIPAGCCPIYAARWEFMYEVTVRPGELSRFIADLPKATIATNDDPSGKKINGS